MTIRNLAPLFAPASVALVGASDRPGSVGKVVLDNVLSGGFDGPVYLVNPKYSDIGGLQCYRGVRDLLEAPSLAVVMTPPITVPPIIDELGALGTRTVVVLTAGITDANGLKQRMLDAARPHLVRVVGPNTIGIFAPNLGLNASFAHLPPLPGRLALLSQSGAIVSSVIDWAVAEGIGFSHIVSLGDMADVDVGDCLDMLALDENTSAILMYLESIPAPRKFMSAARAAARLKPVIVVKPGRHAEAAKAAATHTGALAGTDRVVDAALRRAGIIRVDDLEDLFTAAEVTARFSPMRNARMAIITNGGGAGVLAVDHMLDQGAALAELSDATMATLNAMLPPTWSHANPVDIIGDAPPERYSAAVSAVASDPNVDALLVMNCPTALASPQAAAEAITTKADNGRIGGKPLLTCWLGKAQAEKARGVLTEAGVASFDTPIEAAKAVALLTRWSAAQHAVVRVPESRGEDKFDMEVVRLTMQQVAAEGRRLLTEPEAKSVLRAYHIPVPPTVVAGDEEEVAAAATQLLAHHDALVVKLLSKSITHKSDVGGVVLDIDSADGAQEAAASIRNKVMEQYGAAAFDGVTVQAMIRRPNAQELIAGLNRDPIFGPVILFGAGGTSVEVVDDTAIDLVPLDAVLAGDLIDATRVAKLLKGYRDRSPADRNGITAVLTSLSQMVVDFPCIVSADINPLLADAAGVVALDARIEIDPLRVEEAGPGKDLVIRPYPSGWERRLKAGGQDYLLRPIRPSDAALYPKFLESVTPEDLFLRFHQRLQSFSEEMLIHLTQLDYDRAIAFVALDQSGELAGIVRYAADPDRQTAEFGALVRSDIQRKGLGTAMMKLLMQYARSEGIGCLRGLIQRENEGMRELCRILGFTLLASPEDVNLAAAELRLDTPQ